jgi:hypothetical protein
MAMGKNPSIGTLCRTSSKGITNLSTFPFTPAEMPTSKAVAIDRRRATAKRSQEKARLVNISRTKL